MLGMKARIYRLPKNAMQSGLGKTQEWRLELVTETPREREPLMGWVSAGDTLGEVKLKFPTAEAAVAYAQKSGYEFAVVTPQERKVIPRNFSDNFKYIPLEEA